MIPVNYHHLYYFYAIAREGSVSKAAEVLLLSQPTLSAQLKQFEDYLNIKLFEREGRRLVLTEEGRFALSYAKDIFDLGQEFIDGVQDRSHKGRLRIQIGALDSIPPAIVDALLQLVLKVQPDTYIVFQEDKIDKLIEDLKSHLLDLILTDIPFRSSGKEEIQSHLAGKIPVVFCSNQTLAGNYRKLPKDLDNAPVIFPTAHSQLYHLIQEYLIKHKVAPRIVAEIQDVELVRRMVLSGKGIAPLNVFTVLHAPSHEQLVVLDKRSKPAILDSIYLVTKRRKKPHPLVDKIVAQFVLTT